MKNEYRVKKIGLILGICFCLILSTIPMNKLLPNVINAQTKGIPEKSQSLSNFNSYPSNSSELINESRYKGLTSPEIAHYTPFSPNFDEMALWTTSSTGSFLATRNSTQVAPVGSIYSLRLEYQQEAQNYYEEGYIGQNLPGGTADVISNTTLSFYWYVQSNLFNGNGQDAVFVEIDFNSSKDIQYYVSGDQSSWSQASCNSVSNHNSTGSWYLFNANLTADYMANFSSPLPVNVSIDQISIIIIQQTYRGYGIVAFFDNFSIKTGEVEKLTNGGFETQSAGNEFPDGWNSQFSNSGSITHSNFALEPNSIALNISAAVHPFYPDNSTTCQLDYSHYYDYNSYEISSRHNCNLSVTYFLPSVPLNNTYEAYELLEFYNGTDYRDLDIELATQNTFSNYTNEINLVMNNTSTQWQQLTINLLPLVQLLFPTSTANLTYNGIYMYSTGTSNEEFNIIFQNIGIVTTQFADPDFENPDPTTSYIPGFDDSYMVLNYSSDAYSGSYSGNFSTPGNIQANAYDSGVYSEVTSETMLSLEYNLLNYTGNQNGDQVSIQIGIESWNQTLGDYKYISYLLGASSSSPFVNDSYNGYYYLSTFNQTGSWINLERNLYRDFSAAFPSINITNYYIDYFEIYEYSYAANEPITLLLDNLKLGTGIPVEENLEILPNVPVYNANLNFSLDCFDSGSGIQWANLFVDNGSGFQKYAMTLQDADNQIYTYLLTNASYQYNSTLKYYFVFADNINNTNTYPAGAPTNFLIVRITDKTSPILLSLPDAIGVGTAGYVTPFNVSATDAASGVSSVYCYYTLNGTSIWHNFTLTHVSGSLYNGSIPAFPVNTLITYYFVAWDNENNLVASNATGQYEYLFINPYQPAQMPWLETFGIGAGVMGVAILGIFIGVKASAHRRKNASSKTTDSKSSSSSKTPKKNKTKRSSE